MLGDPEGHGTYATYEFTLHGSHGQLSSADFQQTECSAVPLLSSAVAEGYTGLLATLAAKLARNSPSNGSSSSSNTGASTRSTAVAAGSSAQHAASQRVDTRSSAACAAVSSERHAAGTGCEPEQQSSGTLAKPRSICAAFGAWVECHSGMGWLKEQLDRADTSHDRMLDCQELLQLLTQVGGWGHQMSALLEHAVDKCNFNMHAITKCVQLLT